MSGPDSALTGLLHAWSGGDEDAFVALVPHVQRELRAMAAELMRGERVGHTLQPTALVQEVFVRLIERPGRFDDRAHFFGSMAHAMRRILVDHARRTNAAKRGGGARRLTLSDVTPSADEELDLVALDDALQQLSDLDERQGRVVELRFFGGLDVSETAGVLDVSVATVKRDWTLARAWLYRALA